MGLKGPPRLFFQFLNSPHIIDMGLDQYAYKVKNQPNLPAVDAQFSEWDEKNQKWVSLVPKEDYSEFAYFRKHHDLQGYMEGLYYQKGGTQKTFNCCKVELTLDDINDLEESIKDNSLPPTEGFFFGSGNTDYYKEQSVEFCSKAREAIKEGYRVFYDSWW